MPTREQIIEHLGLVPLDVEGGMFIQSYKASEVIPKACLPDRYPVDKPFGAAIYYLLTDDLNSFSAMHKLPTDEIFHFYLGDPVEMLNLYPHGRSERIILGHDILNEQTVQHIVPHDVWQGCYVIQGGTFALLGTTMAPGYTDEDYVGGEREKLIMQYPHAADLITRLTRVDGTHRVAEG